MKEKFYSLLLRKEIPFANDSHPGKRSGTVSVVFPLLIALSILFFLNSCGSKTTANTSPETPGKSVWSYAQGGIQIHYTADNMLNVFENEPHTLVLAIYQMNNINAFNNLTRDGEGLKKLLQVQSFDSSVVGMDKIIVQPGEEKTVVLNRAEDAKWVGIVAGYYSLNPGQVNRLFNVPLVTEKKGIYGFRTTESRVGQMTIKLILGPTALHEREVMVK